MKEIAKNSTLLFLMIAAVYLGGVGIAQIVNDKETSDWTGTTQGETDSIYNAIITTSTTVDTLLVICDRILTKLDEVETQREIDSVDAYHRYWYEVLDTNSDGDIDGTENRDTIWE